MLCTEHAPSDRDNGYRSVVLRLHGVRYGVPAALLSNRGEARLRELLAEWHPSHGADVDRDNGYRSVVLRLHGVRYGVPAALLSNRGEARLRELLAEWHPSHGAD